MGPRHRCHSPLELLPKVIHGPNAIVPFLQRAHPEAIAVSQHLLRQRTLENSRCLFATEVASSGPSS